MIVPLKGKPDLIGKARLTAGDTGGAKIAGTGLLKLRWI
jgi:hypothetical protein